MPSSIELNNIDLTNSGTNSSATSYDANFIANNIDRNSSYEDTASSEVIGAAAALDTNIEIIGTHLLVPQNSIAQMVYYTPKIYLLNISYLIFILKKSLARSQ